MLDIKYRLTQQHIHCRWDNSIAPLATVEPGDITVDLRVSEIVDAPNWLISAFLPLDIFV